MSAVCTVSEKCHEINKSCTVYTWRFHYELWTSVSSFPVHKYTNTVHCGINVYIGKLKTSITTYISHQRVLKFFCLLYSRCTGTLGLYRDLNVYRCKISQLSLYIFTFLLWCNLKNPKQSSTRLFSDCDALTEHADPSVSHNNSFVLPFIRNYVQHGSRHSDTLSHMQRGGSSSHPSADTAGQIVTLGCCFRSVWLHSDYQPAKVRRTGLKLHPSLYTQSGRNQTFGRDVQTTDLNVSLLVPSLFQTTEK